MTLLTELSADSRHSTSAERENGSSLFPVEYLESLSSVRSAMFIVMSECNKQSSVGAA